MSGSNDFSRQLTRRGKDEVSRNALRLEKRLDTSLLDTALMLFASPLHRAQETASLVAGLLGLPEYHTLDSITSSGHPAAISNQLEPYLTQKDCMIVSHQPCLSRLIAYLTKTEVVMHTATIACLFLAINAPNSGEVEWLIRT